MTYTHPMACDICGSIYGGVTIPASAQFRGMRIACWDHYYIIEKVRMDAAQLAYRNGGKDWYNQLRLYTARSLKPLYRTSIKNRYPRKNISLIEKIIRSVFDMMGKPA